ncbi:hypothetical protein HY628_01205 [Candidatus Uhrbacteria bacterium]|nr:hypothetical protein [Candidatus Uhrbacteria bacterium]
MRLSLVEQWRKQYPGEYLLIDGQGKLVAHGRDPKKTIQEFRQKEKESGQRQGFVTEVFPEDKPFSPRSVSRPRGRRR